MPVSNTWSAPGCPGQGGIKSLESSGREKSWYRTPGFGALPKDEKPVNGYTDIQWKTRQQPEFFIRRKIPGVTDWIYDFPLGLRHANSAIVGSLESTADSDLDRSAVKAKLANDAIVKSLVKMADAKVNVAVAYAEASKTSDLILDTARRIDRAYRAFRKGDLRGIAQNLNITPKRLHKSWLEYKYGWMPLLMDVKGAAEFFAQQHIIRAPRFTVSATEEVTKTKSYVYTVDTYGGGTHPLTAFLSWNCKCRVKIWCELSSPHLSEMQQIGLTNPFLVAWELVPFSFVFDWFISVGDWLTASTAQQGVTVRRKMISYVDSLAVSVFEPGTVTTDTVWIREQQASSWEGSRRGYDRLIPDLSPFSVSPPVTNSFGFSKLVTSLALLQGNYRGTSRTSRI